MVTRDDEYNGYFIPAGTTIVGNTWYVHTSQNIERVKVEKERLVTQGDPPRPSDVPGP